MTATPRHALPKTGDSPVKRYLLDLADRTAWTYLQTLGGLVTAAGFDLIDLASWKAAAVAALPAVYTVIKGAVAKYVNDPETATFLKTGTAAKE